jgi:acetoin utilization deacetylase AcuC-like enzyme
MSFSVVYHPDYVAPLPSGHRFPMQKFRRLVELSLADGVIRERDIERPEPAASACIELAHAPEYVKGVHDRTLSARAMRRIGLPLTEALVRRSLAAVGGTMLAARLALEQGLAFNAAGGSHHAFFDRGSGYCVFNDVVVAGRWLLEEGAARQVLIIDLDVHQGDGTAHMCRREPRLATFSMHCVDNFPARKRASDLDVGLPEGVEDDEYMALLALHLDGLLAELAPDFIFYNAGVDPHAADRLGRLKLSDNGLYARDRYVIESGRRRGIPVVGVVGGGYAESVDVVAYRHTLLHRAARDLL